MPIEVINDAGSVLIDDNYLNLTLALKGAFVLTMTSGFAYTEFTYTSPEPSVMMALELTDIRIGHLSSSRSGNTWTFNVQFNPAYAGRTVTFYIFTIPSAVADAGGIIQLRNAANQLTFDSNLKYMRVEGFYSTTLNNSNVATTMRDTRKYAVSMVKTCWWNQHIRANPLEYAPPYTFMDAAAVGLLARSGSTLVCEYRATQQSRNQSDLADQWTRGSNVGQALLIDVTNF